jgi:hypothetical protein
MSPCRISEKQKEGRKEGGNKHVAREIKRKEGRHIVIVWLE